MALALVVLLVCFAFEAVSGAVRRTLLPEVTARSPRWRWHRSAAPRPGLALGIGSVGLLGKLVADSLEEIDPGPVRALPAPVE